METPISERVMRAFIEQMIRTGVVDQDDTSETADYLDRNGDSDAAHELRCIVLNAITADPADFGPEATKARLVAINGGKSED